MCEARTAMTFYVFGMALSMALTIAVGTSWVRDNRGGLWSKTIIASFTTGALLLGLLLGWSINQWLAWAAATAAQHSYSP